MQQGLRAVVKSGSILHQSPDGQIAKPVWKQLLDSISNGDEPCGLSVVLNGLISQAYELFPIDWFAGGHRFRKQNDGV